MPLIYTNVLSALLFWCSLPACAIFELLGPAGPRRSNHAGASSVSLDRGSLFLLNSSAVGGMLLYFLLPWLAPATTVTWNQPFLFLSGLVLLVLGMALRRYAMAALGRFFVGSVLVQTNQQVVQDGPYRWVRHPAYSGILLATIGVGLMMTNWASLFALLCGLLVGLLYRIQVEEAALQQMLGQPYHTYMQRTKKRLIPSIF